MLPTLTVSFQPKIWEIRYQKKKKCNKIGRVGKTGQFDLKLVKMSQNHFQRLAGFSFAGLD